MFEGQKTKRGFLADCVLYISKAVQWWNAGLAFAGPLSLEREIKKINDCTKQ